MKPRHFIMCAGLIIAGALAIFGDKSPANQLVEPATRRTNSTSPKTTTQAEPLVLKLIPRTDAQHPASVDAALFGNQNWTPPPQPAPPPPPPPPPTAPPIPFTYAGKRLIDGAWEVFLARGDNMIYVHANSVVESAYRVESIAPPTLTLTYIPLNQRQTLSIGDAE